MKSNTIDNVGCLENDRRVFDTILPTANCIALIEFSCFRSWTGSQRRWNASKLMQLPLNGFKRILLEKNLHVSKNRHLYVACPKNLCLYHTYFYKWRRKRKENRVFVWLLIEMKSTMKIFLNISLPFFNHGSYFYCDTENRTFSIWSKLKQLNSWKNLIYQMKQKQIDCNIWKLLL